MIWDYQRHATFDILWDGRLQIEAGQLAKFIGRLSPPTTLHAAVVIERDGKVHEQADHEQLAELYPVEGKVFSCQYRGDRTHIAVYQTIPNLFSFPNLSHHRAFLIVPEFWNYLEERSEWNREAIPGYRQLQQLKRDRYHQPDITDTSWAVYCYGKLSGILAGDQVREINGHISSKLDQLFRLRKRAEFGNRLKLHLLALSPNEGRSYLLDELVHEGPMTLEHAAFVTYAVLDLTAHLVNITLQIGVSELQTSFTAVLGKDSADASSPSLRSVHPSLALTNFWLSEQREWIASLRDIRHEFAHRGAAAPVYGPNERMLAMTFDASPALVSPIYDVQDVVTQWLTRAERFFTESLRLLAEYSLVAVKPFETTPARPPVQAPTINAEIEETLRDMLRLLFNVHDASPQREEHLYARLERDWRKAWPLPKFKKFLSTIEAFTLDQRHAVGFSSAGGGGSATAKAVLMIGGKSYPWMLRLEKKEGGRAYLVRTPLTIPLSLEPQTAVTDFNAQQSGPETGRSCAEFRFALTNLGTGNLMSLVVVVTHGDLEVARSEVGQLAPSQSISVFASTSPELGRTLPPGGPYVFVTLISEPVTVRVVYDRVTDLGNEWADEHRCVNRPRAP